MAERQSGTERDTVPTPPSERTLVHPQGHPRPHDRGHRLREGVLVATLSVATAITALMFAATTTGLPPATQTVVPPELYEPVTIPRRAMVPTIPLGNDEAPRVESPTPTPTPSPTASPRPTPRATPRPQPAPAVSLETSHSVEGTATWYCLPGRSRCSVGRTGGLYAAISPDLDFLRGRAISVCSGASCVVVTVIDCNCQATRAVDLYADAFRVLAPLSAGRLKVTIRW